MALITNLVSYWKLDETSAGAVIDSHGSNNGTNSGADINQTGKIDKAYEFVKANEDYVSADGVDLGNSLSISLWVKTSATVYHWIFANGEEAAGQYTPGQIQMLANGIIRFRIHLSTSAIQYIQYNGGDAVNDGNWHLITITRAAGARAKIYIDGTNQTAGRVERNATWDGTVVYDTSENIFLGKRVGTGGASSAWNDGLIDEVGIWSKELTSAEVTELWNSGNGLAYPFGATGTNLQLNIGDTWKAVAGMQINIGDTWKAVAGMQINIGDTWKEIF